MFGYTTAFWPLVKVSVGNNVTKYDFVPLHFFTSCNGRFSFEHSIFPNPTTHSKDLKATLICPNSILTHQCASLNGTRLFCYFYVSTPTHCDVLATSIHVQTLWNRLNHSTIKHYTFVFFCPSLEKCVNGI